MATTTLTSDCRVRACESDFLVSAYDRTTCLPIGDKYPVEFATDFSISIAAEFESDLDYIGNGCTTERDFKKATFTFSTNVTLCIGSESHNMMAIGNRIYFYIYPKSDTGSPTDPVYEGAIDVSSLDISGTGREYITVSVSFEGYNELKGANIPGF